MFEDYDDDDDIDDNVAKFHEHSVLIFNFCRVVRRLIGMAFQHDFMSYF
jgi:hypothetical protein